MHSLLMVSTPGPLKRIQIDQDERRRRNLVGLMHLCGLDANETGEILSLAHHSVRRKTSGSRSVSDTELAALASLWSRIQRGDVSGLPDGCAAVASALQWIHNSAPHPDDEAIDNQADRRGDFETLLDDEA